MNTEPIRIVGGAVRVAVLVVPNASRSHIVGVHGDAVRIRITSAPEKGKANRELVSLLVAATGATHGTVVSGMASRRKAVDLMGVEVDVVRSSLIDDM